MVQAEADKNFIFNFFELTLQQIFNSWDLPLILYRWFTEQQNTP